MTPPLPLSPSMSPQPFDELRQEMVEQQLRARGIQDPRVLEAMQRIPREEFVPEALRQDAYEDCALRIGFGQTISQPFTVAFMLQALGLEGSEKVLDIGGGSGYAAAVLSQLAREVHSVERIPQLAAAARQRLASLGAENVHVHLADGVEGLPDEAPFDAIVVAAGAARLPRACQDQLADGGRLVIPIGDLARQTLCQFVRHGDRLTRTSLGAFTFVPLIGEYD